MIITCVNFSEILSRKLFILIYLTTMKFILLFCLICDLFITIFGYKPVFLMHGIMTGSICMETIKARIEEVRFVYYLICKLINYFTATSWNNNLQY